MVSIDEELKAAKTAKAVIDQLSTAGLHPVWMTPT